MPVRLNEKEKKLRKAKLLRSISLPKFPSFSKASIAKVLGDKHIIEINEHSRCGSEDLDTMSCRDSSTDNGCESEYSIKPRWSKDVTQEPVVELKVPGVELFGLLTKQVASRRHHTNKLWKWSRRFMVLKEGFLFYYSESEKRDFERFKQFNSHPKGVIPLGGCIVEPCEEIGHKFGIVVTNLERTSIPVILAADDAKSQDKWIIHLREATNITLQNCKLGDVMIKELEKQGLKLHQEKQTFVDRLQSEATALRDEIDRCEELERLKIELEFEKRKLETLARELKMELDSVKMELEATVNTKQRLEDEKVKLSFTNEELHVSLQDLEKERSRIIRSLTQQEMEKQRLSNENSHLCKATQNLKSQLGQIETKTLELLNERSQIQEKLKENEHKSQVLEEEKEYFSSHAKQLTSSLHDLAVQKEMTEAELKDEIMARLNAEKQLSAAEKALEHLELALKLSGANMSALLKEKIMPDVDRLKKFFENCAEEAKLDANRPVIMKNAVYARKSFLRKCKNRLRNSFKMSTLPRAKQPNSIKEEAVSTAESGIDAEENDIAYL